MQVQRWGFKLKHKENKVNDLDLRVKKNFLLGVHTTAAFERVAGANANGTKDGHKSRNIFFSVGGRDVNSNAEYSNSVL